jgi:transcriptional regulator with PAS, ATPase and Fis domain
MNFRTLAAETRCKIMTNAARIRIVRFDCLIGASPKFRAALEVTDMVAQVDGAVLVQGETDTGKELIAQAIHDASPFDGADC